MQIFNETGLKVAWTPWQVRPPQESLTLIVKGLFRMVPGGTAALLPDDEKALPSGDLFTDEDPARGLEQAGDFAPYKPRADLILSGSCHTPGAAPAETCTVAFAVGTWRKSLSVFGDRFWVGDGSQWQLSRPRPFTEKPIGYPFAFGGPGFAANPVGRGTEVRRDPSGRQVVALPNVELPGQGIRSPADRPPPAGFGPVSPLWAPRSSVAGTYSEAWQQTRWPYFPEDFDWGHFNAAPPDQQLDGFLAGDETLGFENLHPAHPSFGTRLPGLRARCFLVAMLDGKEKFREVPLRLDTLSVEMQPERLSLVWRGLTPIRDREHRELTHLYLAIEPLGEAPASHEGHLRAFLAQRGAAAAAYELEGEETGAQPAAVLAAAALQAQPTQAEIDAEVKAALAEARETLLSLGVDAETLDSIEGETDPEVILRKLLPEGAHGTELADDAVAAGHRELSKTLTAAGYDSAVLELLDNPESPAGLQAGVARLRTFLAARGVDTAILGGIEEAVKAATEAKAAEAGEARSEFAVQDLSGRDLSGRNLAGRSFAMSDLTGANLSRADLRGADFTDAILTDADLRDADLAEADLSRATLPGAILARSDLRGAKLDEADATKADLGEADLTGASLQAGIFAGARLSAAKLTGVAAAGANLSQANLAEADLSQADLAGADLSGTALDNARLDGATLREATLEGAAGQRVSMVKADLTELRAAGGAGFTNGSFSEVLAPESIWMDAVLTGCDFSFAELERANFTGADMTGCNLHAVELRNGNLSKARLGGARITEANLFRARLEQAEITEADFRGSNLYEAEFFEATGENPRFEGANLKMTKIAEAGSAS